MPHDKKIFVGQKALIEKNGKVLILFNKKELHIPGGKIQVNELDVIESLKREVQEETSLEIEVGNPIHTFLFQQKGKDPKEIYAVVYACVYKSGKVHLNHEHESYEWVDKNTLNKFKEESEFFKSLEKYFEMSK